MEHATAFQRDLWKVETEKSLKMLRDEGVKIIEPDIEAFRASSAGIIKKYSDKVIGPLVEKIQAVN
jgi:TRAP-type C4-dicarboxylate transport system substrate-binding protein